MPEPAEMSPAPEQDKKGIKRMHDANTVQRFIELRVQGRSFARIAQELGVSKPTLIDWSRKHQHTIANLAAIEREDRLNQLLATGEERLRQLGDQLRVAEAELITRDLTTLSTGRLLTHIESLRRQLRREAGPIQFTTTVDAIPENEYADRIQVWNP
jgi:transposase-like protein